MTSLNTIYSNVYINKKKVTITTYFLKYVRPVLNFSLKTKKYMQPTTKFNLGRIQFVRLMWQYAANFDTLKPDGSTINLTID